MFLCNHLMIIQPVDSCGHKLKQQLTYQLILLFSQVTYNVLQYCDASINVQCIKDLKMMSFVENDMRKSLVYIVDISDLSLVLSLLS